LCKLFKFLAICLNFNKKVKQMKIVDYFNEHIINRSKR
jgi:hypothetical protein